MTLMPHMNLRFVSRDITYIIDEKEVIKIAKVLQQEFAYSDTGKCIWKDVPLVESED